jgi:uncharacterized protein (DUF305 family)
VVAGSLVVLLAVATATIVMVESRQRDGGYGMHQVMAGQPDGGRRFGSPGARDGMHGAAVDTEFDYLTEMVAHHEEAVAAARQLERSDRPQMRAFGQSIVASQTAQIDQMKGWLSEWYPGRSTDVDYDPMMRDLSRLSGDTLDRVFLQDMIPHHMMAVMMSQQLLVRGVADHDEVNTLAVSIRDDQHDEIFWMQGRLAAWFDTGWRQGMGSHMHGGSGMGAGMMW